jgi:hypothetical protein
MKANKLAVLMVIGLLPLAGCAAPRDRYASGAYAGYQSPGPYDGYDRGFDDGDAGYGPPPAPYYSQGYGQPGYAPQGGYASGCCSQSASAYPAYPAPAYSGPSYSSPSYSGQAAYSQSCCGTPSYGTTSYGAGYSSSGYSSSYYSAPTPPPVRYPAPSQPSYYSTYYGCSCGR